MTALKEMRISKQITQQEAARRLGISLRSYIMYENDAAKENTIKYRFLLQELQKINAVDATKETGLRFYEIAERLRESLHKKVDLLDVKQLVNNETLIDEMLKEGIKIYG